MKTQAVHSPHYK